MTRACARRGGSVCDRFNCRTERLRVELPLVIETEARGHFTHVSSVGRLGMQPRRHVRAFAPRHHRAEPDEPHQRAVGVIEKQLTDSIDRR